MYNHALHPTLITAGQVGIRALCVQLEVSIMLFDLSTGHEAGMLWLDMAGMGWRNASRSSSFVRRHVDSMHLGMQRAATEMPG